MYRVIAETPPQEKPTMLVADLTGKEILAYKCPESKVVCIIAKVRREPYSTWQFAFVPISHHQFGSVYCGKSFWDCARKAAAERNVYSFTDYQEFAKALYNGAIN